jgi:adenylyl- and sulfurtransferase ThiI
MIKDIPVFCQLCKDVDILPTFGTLHNFVNRKWDLIWQSMSEQERVKTNMSKIVGYIQITLDAKRVRNAIKKETYITFYCRRCMAIETCKWYQSHGYNAIRYGNVVADINWAEQNMKQVQEVITKCKK